MLLKTYRLRPVGEFLNLPPADRPEPVDIVAPDMQSAWRKFCCQRFGACKPAATDWDISLHNVRST